jgi:hypothetical protein
MLNSSKGAVSMRTLLIAVCLLAGGSSIQAQRTPIATGQLRGIVYDSLAGSVLAGARIFVRNTELVGVSDASGRFRIDNVPSGQRTVLFEHDSLDAIGIAVLGHTVQVASGRPTVVELATPSQATVRRNLCGNQIARGAADTAIVFGTVRDAVGRRRLSGARVRLRWTAVQRQGMQGPIDILRPFRDERTDSLGNYYACGVAPGIVLQVQAFADSGSSGVTEAITGARGIVRHDLLVARSRTRADAEGNLRGRAVLIGVVRLESGAARPGVRVGVDDTAEEVYTDEAGRFVLRNLPTGTHMVMARLVGYTAVRRPVDLSERDTARIEVSMRALTVLDTLQVTASGNPLFDELFDRINSRTVGQVIMGEELARAASARSVLQRFNGLRISGPTIYNYRIYSGINCPVRVFIDGMPGSTDEMQSYRNDQLLAVEYFPRGTQAPMFAADDPCGVVLVWTKYLARPR